VTVTIDIHKTGVPRMPFQLNDVVFMLRMNKRWNISSVTSVSMAMVRAKFSE
jgi:hypothetical protein